MHAIIPYMLAYWAHPVVYLLLLKSSMANTQTVTEANKGGS